MMVCLNIIRFIEVKFELRIKVNGSGFTTTDRINWRDLEAAAEVVLQK